jgi:antirestriction protein
MTDDIDDKQYKCNKEVEATNEMMIDDESAHHSISSSESDIVSLLILMIRKKEEGKLSMAVKDGTSSDLLLLFTRCRGRLFVLFT